MVTTDVILGFDMLLEDLEQVIPDLNAQISELAAQKKFDQAQVVLDKAKQVTAVQQKVQALREEWKALNLTTQEPPKPQPEPGLIMTQQDLRIPILQALVTLGGKAHCQIVFTKLEETIGNRFTEADWQTMPSNDKEIHWINSARWSRLQMVEEGLLSSNSPHGIWEITPQGRKFLEINS